MDIAITWSFSSNRKKSAFLHKNTKPIKNKQFQSILNILKPLTLPFPSFTSLETRYNNFKRNISHFSKRLRPTKYNLTKILSIFSHHQAAKGATIKEAIRKKAGGASNWIKRAKKRLLHREMNRRVLFRHGRGMPSAKIVIPLMHHSRISEFGSQRDDRWAF